MAIVYVLAHFDDEFCGLPLIRRLMAQGVDQRFVYLADYADPKLAARRHSESRAFFRRIGMTDDPTLHLGAGQGWLDGGLHRHVRPALEGLSRAVAAMGSVERLVTLAWEGGHADHDSCAALTAGLAARLGDVPVDQLSIYHGAGLPGWLFHGFSPLPQNGPVTEIPVRPAELARWMALAACYPSQATTWLGLLPALAASVLQAGAFRYQTLAPGRVDERPHAGRLLYERMFRAPYAEVRAAARSLKEAP